MGSCWRAMSPQGRSLRVALVPTPTMGGRCHPPPTPPPTLTPTATATLDREKGGVERRPPPVPGPPNGPGPMHDGWWRNRRGDGCVDWVSFLGLGCGDNGHREFALPVPPASVRDIMRPPSACLSVTDLTAQIPLIPLHACLCHGHDSRCESL